MLILHVNEYPVFILPDPRTIRVLAEAGFSLSLVRASKMYSAVNSTAMMVTKMAIIHQIHDAA